MLQPPTSRATCLKSRGSYMICFATECVATGTDPSSPATCKPRVQPPHNLSLQHQCPQMEGCMCAISESARNHIKQQLTCSARTSRSFTASETSTLLTSATVLTCRHQQSRSKHGVHLRATEHGVLRNSAQALYLVLPCIQQEPDNSVVLTMSLCKNSPWTCTSLSLQDRL